MSRYSKDEWDRMIMPQIGKETTEGTAPDGDSFVARQLRGDYSDFPPREPLPRSYTCPLCDENVFLDQRDDTWTGEGEAYTCENCRARFVILDEGEYAN